MNEITWNTVLQVNEDNIEQFERIKNKYEKDAEKPKVKECTFVEFVVLLFLQVILFPTRGIPYYMLQLPKKINPEQIIDENKNILELSSLRNYVLYFGIFKTKKKYGIDIRKIQDNLRAMVNDLFQFWLNICRPILMKNQKIDHGFVFVNTKGAPFEERTFSTFFSNEMEKRVGEKVGLIRLRHLFATDFYDHNPTPDEENAVSKAMHTSSETLRKIYDDKRKEREQNVAHGYFEKRMREYQEQSSSSETESQQTDFNTKNTASKFVEDLENILYQLKNNVRIS